MSGDMRRFDRQTKIYLMIGFLVLLFVVGGGLVWWIYGREAALVSVACLGILIMPLGLVWLVLLAMEWGAKRGE